MVVLSDMAEQPDGDRPSSATNEIERNRSVSTLTSIQRRAARMVALGRKVTHVARALRVAPSTIFEWRKRPEFAAEVERWHREQEDAVRSRLYDAFPLAIEILKLESKNAYAKSMERTIAAKSLVDAMLKVYLSSKSIAGKTKDADRSADDIARETMDAIRKAKESLEPPPK